MKYQGNKEDLETAIFVLERLLENRRDDEKAYQQYFETFPIVFRILGYKRAIPFTKESGRRLPHDKQSGLRPEPDFIAERDDGLFEIFEIKTPVEKKLVLERNPYREKFAATVNSYLSQTITYKKYFRNPVNCQAVAELHGLHVQEELDIKIVIGRDEYIDFAKVHEHARNFNHKIDIITYDSLRNRLCSAHDQMYGGAEGAPGITICSITRFHAGARRRKRYWLDIGERPNRNRISVLLDKRNTLCFEVRDRRGRKHKLNYTNADELFDEWIYLACEFGALSDGFFMALYINGEEESSYVEKAEVELTVPFRSMFQGCDLTRRNLGCFDEAEKVIYDQKLSFRDRLQLLQYFAERYGSEFENLRKYIEFNGHAYLYRNVKGNMIQEANEFQPVFRVV